MPVEVVPAIFAAMRRASAAGVMVSNAVATRVGLNPIDLECLDFIVEQGSATAGQIGARSGLTSGAVTGLIDRLVKAGYVSREFSDSDRRKVFVVPQAASVGRLESLYAPVARAMAMVTTDYSAGELELVTRFLTQASAATEAAIAAIAGDEL